MLKLNTVLLVNGLTTLPFAIAIWLFSSQMSHHLGGISPFFLELLAFGLLSFSVLACWCAKYLNTSIIRLVTGLDCLWVVMSVWLLTFDPLGLSQIASIVIFIIALWVCLMIVLEGYGLRAIKQQSQALNAS